jgi:inner membrane protein
MDPLTHALTGAAVAWAATGSRLGRHALVIGGLAALAPDLDVLIRSADDPLLAIEHHRGFTHALVFTPIGGAVIAALWSAAARPLSNQAAAHHRWRWAWLAGFLAYLSHALLDAATTYGTQLFWPFSRYRVGLDVISIIDPLFTLVLLAGAIAAYRARTRAVYAVLAIAAVWLAIGFIQRERAFSAQERLAAQRGDRIERAAVFPTVGNTIVWRSLYESSGTLHMDRIRVPWPGESTVVSGPAVPRVSPHGATPRMRSDFARFAWFSDGWVAADPADPTLLGDARYSIHSDRYRPVWGIRLHPDRTEWVSRTTERRQLTP